MAVSKKQLAANRKNAKKGGRPMSPANRMGHVFREKLAAHLTEKADEYIAAMSRLALGAEVEKVTSSGERYIYRLPPDSKAWQAMMDRGFGKPKETINHQNNGEAFRFTLLDAHAGNTVRDDAEAESGVGETDG